MWTERVQPHPCTAAAGAAGPHPVLPCWELKGVRAGGWGHGADLEEGEPCGPGKAGQGDWTVRSLAASFSPGLPGSRSRTGCLEFQQQHCGARTVILMVIVALFLSV